MREITCCFTGHRDLPSEKIPQIETALDRAVERSFQEGFLYFACGGARGFDTLAALAVIRAKVRYPEMRLLLVLPCLDQTRGWLAEDIATYQHVLFHADKVIYTGETYRRGCMHVRNRYLVDHSTRCICYCTERTGGTAYTVEYAVRQGLDVIHLAK